MPGSLTHVQAAITKGLLARGEKQHDIAAFFGVNAGRVADIKTGKMFADVAAAPSDDLPGAADVAGGYAIHVAEQAIIRAKMALDVAMAYLQDSKDRGAS